MIKPADAMWRESMEILAMERIRGTNKRLSGDLFPDRGFLIHGESKGPNHCCLVGEPATGGKKT
jgi:hypothetical protein